MSRSRMAWAFPSTMQALNAPSTKIVGHGSGSHPTPASAYRQCPHRLGEKAIPSASRSLTGKHDVVGLVIRPVDLLVVGLGRTSIFFSSALLSSAIQPFARLITASGIVT